MASMPTSLVALVVTPPPASWDQISADLFQLSPSLLLHRGLGTEV